LTRESSAQIISVGHVYPGRVTEGFGRAYFLSKTTKLLLLDSLLQEVCIESGSDGSLTLSLLGLSVCLVSHNLLYAGLKKAYLTHTIHTILLFKI
jgi:hypothetical protein